MEHGQKHTKILDLDLSQMYVKSHEKTQHEILVYKPCRFLGKTCGQCKFLGRNLDILTSLLRFLCLSLCNRLHFPLRILLRHSLHLSLRRSLRRSIRGSPSFC